MDDFLLPLTQPASMSSSWLLARDISTSTHQETHTWCQGTLEMCKIWTTHPLDQAKKWEEMCCGQRMRGCGVCLKTSFSGSRIWKLRASSMLVAVDWCTETARSCWEWLPHKNNQVFSRFSSYLDSISAISCNLHGFGGVQRACLQWMLHSKCTFSLHSVWRCA